MPELPEVESLALYLRDTATDLRVARADVAAISVLKTVDPPVSALEGARLVDASRRGKFLDIVLVDEDGEVLHLVTQVHAVYVYHRRHHRARSARWGGTTASSGKGQNAARHTR